MQDFQIVLPLAMATVAVSIAIAKSRAFLPMRTNARRVSAWLGDLVSCWYCTSHWIAMILCMVYQPMPLHVSTPLDLFVGWAATVCLATLIGGMILLIVPFAKD